MKKIHFFTALVICFAFGTKLEAQTYNFTKSTANYSDLTNATDLTMGIVWDDPALVVPVSFPFSYFGQNVDSILIDYGLGGLLVMTVDTINAKATLFVADDADLIDRGYNSNTSLSPISYETTGVPNNRILKIEWKNVGFYSEHMDDSISSDFINFQVWFFESDNSIEIHYGPNSVSQPFLSYDGHTGTTIALIPELDLMTGGPGNSWHNLHSDVNNPSYSTRLASDTPLFFNNTIPNGTVYRFSSFTVSLEENIAENEEMFISPNPVINNISLFNVGEKAINSISIVDVKGKQVMDLGSTASKNIDVSELKAGIYLLQVHSTEGIKHLKFIKK